jgi:hypothetical protein
MERLNRASTARSLHFVEISLQIRKLQGGDTLATERVLSELSHCFLRFFELKMHGRRSSPD